MIPHSTKLKAILFLAFLTFNIGISAQAPGVVGNRWSIFYDFAFTPTFGHTIPYDYSNKKEKSLLNQFMFNQNVELEFALNRKMGIGVDYFHQKGGYANKSNYNDSKQEPYFSRNFSRHGIGIFYRLYRVNLNGYRSDEGALAPIGYYWEPRVFMSKDKYQIKGNPDYFDGYDIVVSTRNVTHFGVSIKLGRHLLLVDKLMMDFGVEFGYVLPAQFDKRDAAGIIDTITFEDLNHPYNQMALHHLVSFHIGFGYAIF